MEFDDLIVSFAARHGVEGLAAENGFAALEVDGVAVSLVEVGSTLAATAEIGEPPTEGRAEFADALLEANLGANTVFAKSAETGRYVLMRRLPLAQLDDTELDAAIEDLVNSAETWRRLLADFRPAAEAAAASETSAPAFGFPGGFLQV